VRRIKHWLTWRAIHLLDHLAIAYIKCRFLREIQYGNEWALYFDNYRAKTAALHGKQQYEAAI